MKKLIGFALMLVALTLLTGCPNSIKPWARTALEAARHACAVYAEQTGVTFEDVCNTEEKLRPFIDSILAAQQAAAASGATGACPECPECKEGAAPTPEAKPAPEPAPAPPAPAPAPAPAPEPEKK